MHGQPHIRYTLKFTLSLPYLKFTKFRLCPKWRSCVNKWDIEQEALKTIMCYYLWDYSVARFYSSSGVPGRTLHFRYTIWFLNLLFIISDDGKVQKLTNPEREVAVHRANWQSVLFVYCLQIRSLFTVVCHCLRGQGHRIRFCDGTS